MIDCKKSHGWKVVAGICMYYPLSIGLTFYQKWFLKNYRFPLLVVTGHYFCKLYLAIFFRWLIECRGTRRVRLSFKEQLIWLVPIGFCASLDIGLSNWALEYVTVSLYTMAKSSSILFIVVFALILRLEKWRNSLGVSAFFIAFGLFLFTWRASELNLRGLMLVELAAACTGLRWTVSQMVMQGDDKMLKHPLDMVAHVQPWMIIAILPLLLSIEGSELNLDSAVTFHGQFAPFSIILLIMFGGCLAFAMEMAEYLLLIHTSGITLNIFGIVKEVVTLLLAHFVNGDRLTVVNIFGLLLCLCGIFIHGISKRQNIVAKAQMDRQSLLTDVDS